MARNDGYVFQLDAGGRTAIKEEMRAILIQFARQGETITYSDLSLRLQYAPLHPHSFLFSHILRDICREEETAGHGQLCALVVSKTTGMPGGGYFRRDIWHNLETDDLETMWRSELESVFDYWQNAE